MQFVRVYRAMNATEAHLLKGLLEQHGMQVRLFGDGLASGVGELPADVIQVDVAVPRGFLQLATELIDEYERGGRLAVAGDTWRCTGCGEENPANFESCWKCRQGRPS